MDYRKLSLSCAAIVLAGCSAIAPALASDTARHITVKYEDLNLASREGASTLLARIRGAARQVCGQQSERLDLEHAWELCYQGSVAAAVATVDSPQLTSLANGYDSPTMAALQRR